MCKYIWANVLCTYSTSYGYFPCILKYIAFKLLSQYIYEAFYFNFQQEIGIFFRYPQTLYKHRYVLQINFKYKIKKLVWDQ